MHHHHPALVALCLLIAVLGSWTALDLFRRVRSHIGQARQVWLAAAALCLGLSIWSMHFVAMLGFDPGGPIRYDPWLTAQSLLLAVGATWGAFVAAPGASERRGRLLGAGAAMGLGICLMHYVGMAAVRTATPFTYRASFVVASLLIAVVASTAALLAARRERTVAWRAIGALALGGAIAGMHYTAMAGMVMRPAMGAVAATSGAAPVVLGVALATGVSIILIFALLASLYDQRLNVLAALDAGRVGYWELVLPAMELHLSARGKAIFGRAPEADLSHAQVLAALETEDRARRDLIFPQAIQEAADYDAEYRVRLPDGSPRWVNFRGRVTAWSGRRARRMAGVVLDVTDRREAFDALSRSQAAQRLLIDELNHRVKNTLATVQSIARQSAKGAASTQAFQDAFEARLVALSQTHNALTRGGWSGASLRELLDQELAPYDREQVAIVGEDLALSPREALALGMVFHELSTNAAKYGALRAPEGRVAIGWTQQDGRVEIVWRETGGPPVQAPTRRGFGSRLIEGSLGHELGGEAELTYPKSGFTARLTFARRLHDARSEPLVLA